MISDVFPHIGEAVLEKMISEEPDYITKKLGLAKDRLVAVHRQIPILFPSSAIIFDGFSTIDIGLQLDDDSIFPIEVKLGFTGLARATINNKLRACSVSAHQNEARVCGNILAIMNRYFDSELEQIILSDSLHAEVNNQIFKVREDWGIIARKNILSSWEKFPPKFNNLQNAIELEALCKNYGEDKFNILVTSMLCGLNYYDRWVSREA